MNISKYQNFEYLTKKLILASFLISFKLLIPIRSSIAQVIIDSTLGKESSEISSDIDINGNLSNLITGGATRGMNLFHSFERFNVLKDRGIYFENPSGIQNIIARVTLIDPLNNSKIMGSLGVINANGTLGNSNFFLINPNGILFGSGSSLDLGGSFIATTANALRFKSQEYFDVLDPNPPQLLNINPSGFLFTQEKVFPIVNLSNQISGFNKYLDPVLNEVKVDDLFGLRVSNNHSLIFLGGPISINNGGLYSLGGRVEIGSVSGKGFVELSYKDTNPSLIFPSILERDNITLSQNANVYASGERSAGGNVRFFGKNIVIETGSQVVSYTTGQGSGGTIILDATELIRLSNFKENGVLSTNTFDSGSAGDINIFANNLTVDQNAQIFSSTFSNGSGGNITINANELINLKGLIDRSSGISSGTASSGVGGNISIKTFGDLILSDSAVVFSGGLITATAQGDVYSSGVGGNIDVIADKSIKLDNGFLSAQNIIGKAGSISVKTQFLEIRNGGTFKVDSPLNTSGKITINADSLNLNNGGLFARTGVRGAEIDLNINNILSLKNESVISANARDNASGGNIDITVPILLTFPPTGTDGSDIVANADKGRGGNIVINSKGIFGIQKRNSQLENQTNDISASSQFGPSGQIQINSAINPTQGIEELPSTVVDPSTLVAQNPCKHASGSEFVRSGRGGLPPSISQDFDSNTSRVGLVQPIERRAEKVESKPASKVVKSQAPAPLKILPAQGWIYNDKGQAVLVAYNPSTSGPQRSQPTPASCPAF